MSPSFEATPEIVATSRGDALDRAVDTLRSGGLVALPTETVYGLAAAMDQPEAIARVYSSKRRPTTHPLIVHLAESPQLLVHAIDIDPRALRLSEAFWPGPLSLLVDRGPSVPDSVVAGGPTAVFRVPANAFTRTVISALGVPIVAPSANRFGEVSPTTASHVVASLGQEVDLVVDDGPCPIGVESTIVDCTADPFQILRPGAVLRDEIESVIGESVETARGEARAPGMLASHYAPRATVLLAIDEKDAEAIRAALPEDRQPVVVLGRGIEAGAYAARLYADLRSCDEESVRTVVAILPHESGIGVAVADRLRRAAAAR